MIGAGVRLVLLVASLVFTACGSSGEDGNEIATNTPAPSRASTPPSVSTPTHTPTSTPTATATVESRDARVARVYPDLAALYGGEHGIYRGCGPNSGVCHNSRQYPNLRSLESVADVVGRPCNQLRENPFEVHDWCEGRGDALRIGDDEMDIGYFEQLDEQGLEWMIHLRDEPPFIDGQSADIARDLEAEIRVLYSGLEFAELTSVSAGEGGPGVRIKLPPRDRFPYSSLLAEAFSTAGTPGNPSVIMLGDPNRNGRFGADLGNALILPGSPTRSYMMRRLTDPSFGTLMPLANCCFWTKDSLRALWCWIAGLEAGGDNVFEPIDYASCPEGPVENVLYPEPGSLCEAQGICPVRAEEIPLPGGGFAPVLSILRTNCAGSECHIGGRAGGFSIPDNEDAAYSAVLTRVVPDLPEESPLYVRVDRDACDLPQCIPMPFGRAPLTEEDLTTIREWIEDGALR